MELYLADKSALSRLHRPLLSAAITPYARRLATCCVIQLEVGWSARNAAHYAAMMAALASHAYLEVTQEVATIALKIQHSLVRRGHHRAPSVADLLVAATAIHHCATVLHYDRDFELIAEVDQRLRQRWIVRAAASISSGCRRR